MKWIVVIGLLTFGCESSDYIRIENNAPICKNDGRNWYFVHCSNIEETVCSDDWGQPFHEDCTFNTYGVRYNCVSKCSE